MTAVIGQAQAVIADDEFPCVCRDCGQPLDVIKQSRWNGGYITLATCWSVGCGLHGVTLSPEEHARLSERELQSYRQVNQVKG